MDKETTGYHCAEVEMLREECRCHRWHLNMKEYNAKIHGGGTREQRVYAKKAGTFQATEKQEQDL